MKRRRKQPEQEFQSAVAVYLDLALKPPTVWSAIGHGGGGGLRGAILKGMGVKAGMPDVLVLHPDRGRTVVLGLELKAPRGRISPDQIDMGRAFIGMNATYSVCRALEEVQRAIRRAGIPLHARVAGESQVRAAA